MTSTADFLKFLENLSVDNLDDVLEDCKYIIKGNKIFYIVDTHDIINFTLPFITSNWKNNSLNNFSQHTIAYEVIFTNKDRFNLSLLDQYKVELSNIQSNIIYKLKNFPSVKDKLFAEITNVESKMQNKSEGKYFITKNIEAFTSLYIFLIYGSNIYERFNKFVKNYLNIKTFNSPDEKLNTFINTIFENSRQTNFTDKLFDTFVNDSFLKLATLGSDYERFCYLENSYRDIVVVDRINTVNSKLKTVNIKFQYLSSAQNKTMQIFKSAKTIKNDEIELCESRNIMQLYLLNYILDLNSTIDESRELILALKIYKEQSEERKKLFFESDNSNMIKIISKLVNTYDSYKIDLEKSFFYKTYFKYKDIITELQNNNQIDETQQKVIDYIDRFNTSIDKTEFKVANVISNIEIVSKLNKTFNIEKGFLRISKANNIINIPIGKDIVKNFYHHLPFLLLIDSVKEEEYFHSFYKFVDEFSNYPLNIGIPTNEFSDLFNLVAMDLAKLKNRSIPSFSFQFLILTFVNLITIPNSSENINIDMDIDLPDSEKELIDDLLKTKQIYSYTSGKTYILEQNGNKYLRPQKHESEFTKEIDYLLIWIYRRNLNFDNAINLASANIYENEPRIQQGLGLALISKAYYIIDDKQNEKEIIKLFNLGIKHLEKSFFLYDGREQSFPLGSKSNLLIKQKIAILNAIIDANLRIYEYNNVGINELSLFQTLRNYLTILKKFVSELLKFQQYEDLDTINHTESELEYFEALYFIAIGDIFNAIRKLSYASKRTFYFTNNKQHISDRFKRLAQKIEEKRFEIFAKKNIV